MNLIITLQFISIIHFQFLEISACFKDNQQRVDSKENFPFQNYYLVSTSISAAVQKSSKAKRSTKLNNCILLHLNFSHNNYEMCIQKHSILDSEMVDENTKFMIYNKKSKRAYQLNQTNIKFVKGYIITKPYSSSFSGYISNNQLYGTMEIESKMYYIEPLENFPFLAITNEITRNAIIYQIVLDHYNTSTFFNQINPYGTLRTPKPFNFRHKRSTDDTVVKPVAGKVCTLLILIDSSFLRIVSKNNIKLAIITVLHSLDLANAIFRITDFNNDGIPDNIGFMVKYVLVFESENIGNNRLPKYSTQSIDGRLYLYFLSQYELLREVCLGIAFTAQPFLFRALGLSYTALIQASNLVIPNSGGICERPSRIDFGQSFNNLVITYRLENRESVPQITSDLSLAHELGHSFGSDHDLKQECYGFLMSPHTFNGTYGHNFMFSPCSKKQISKVLKYKKYCLETSTTPFCGNGLVEENEDCDCGYPFSCILKDPCCIARNTKGPSCKVNKKAGYECHPSQGSCCLSDCSYRNISFLELSCTNFDKKCPCSNLKKDCPCGILGRCVKNKCHSNECTRIGLKECKCKNQSKEQKCATCCRSKDGKCLPSKILTKVFTANNEQNVDYLRQHFVKEKSSENTTTKNYEDFCVDNKCISLPFRTFDKGSFCLFKGLLGICDSNYRCSVNIGIQSQFPVFKEKTANYAEHSHRKGVHCLLFYLFYTTLFVIFNKILD